MRRFAVLLITGQLIGTISAQAGDVLKLKTGNFSLPEVSEKLLLPAATSDEARYFVVQFKNPVSEQDKSRLRDIGLEPIRYLPDDAFLTKGTVGAAREAALVTLGIKAIVPYQSDWKLSPEFLEQDFKSSNQMVLISLIDESAQRSVVSTLKGLAGVKLVRAESKDIVIETGTQSLADVSQIEGVEWIQPLPVVITFDLPMSPEDIEKNVLKSTFTGHESGTKVMNFEAMWDKGFTGAGQTVGMADTGLDRGNVRTIHADLTGVIKGYAQGLGASSWEDPQGHGTHVTGSVIGNGASSAGNLKGGAHQSKYVVVGMWSPLLDNIAPTFDFKLLIGKPYSDGARIHTNSWGAAANLGAYDTLASRVDEYMWQNPEMLVLFAAGNSGQDANKDGRIDEGSVSSPGTAKNVMTVGASENTLATGGIQKTHGELKDGLTKWGAEPIKSDTLSNNPNGLAAFSSRGPTKDGRLKPEIVAPGTNIVSTRSKHPKATLLWGEFDANYVYAGGTSMATPLTAGAAAVAREYLVKTRGLAQPSAAVLKATMIHTAKDMYPGQYGTGPKQELPKVRPNVHEGYGRVDMDAVASLGAETQITDYTQGVGLNEVKAFTVNIAQGGSLRATLVYTDAPGTTSAAKALVNDLDLSVTGPNGKRFQISDRINNTEMIEQAGLAAGAYKVSVRGVNVPQGRSGKQPFALVLSVQ